MPGGCQLENEDGKSKSKEFKQHMKNKVESLAYREIPYDMLKQQ